MNNRKGFIQVSLIVVIIASVLVFGGMGYFGLKQYQSYQAEKIEQAKIAQEKERVIKEKEKEAQMAIEAQQEALEVAQKEIDKLKEQSAESKKTQQQLEQKVKNQQQKSTQQNISISAADLDLYLSGVVRIVCNGEAGSGSLWNIGGQGYRVLTNQHVVEGESGICNLDVTKINNNSYGFYDAVLNQKYSWNNTADATILGIQINKQANDAIVNMTSSANESIPVSGLNYNISAIRRCPVVMPLGSPVALVGYPAFSQQVDYYEGRRVTAHFRTVTNGIISAHDTSVKYFQGLPYYNYFVSAKIDSGNSGGIALSKDSDGLCVLGIPTWVTLGNYETQGIVQNIHNVMYQ